MQSQEGGDQVQKGHKRTDAQRVWVRGMGYISASAGLCTWGFGDPQLSQGEIT